MLAITSCCDETLAAESFTKLCVYFFVTMMGLGCCDQAFPELWQGGAALVAVRRLLIAMASLVSEQSIGHLGFSSCGAWA